MYVRWGAKRPQVKKKNKKAARFELRRSFLFFFEKKLKNYRKRFLFQRKRKSFL